MFDLHSKNCEILVLNKNFLKYLPCDCLPFTLVHLSLDQNDLHNLELDMPFPRLKTLTAEKNDMEFLSLQTSLPSLTYLNLKHNCLWNLEFLSACPALETLNITRNEIEVVEALPSSLKELKAEFNQIKMCQSRLPEGILHVNLLGNELKMAGLPLSWGSSLRTLHLGYNFLTEFPKHLPDTLEDLGLQNNLLEEIPSKLPANLKRLSIVGNQIKKLPTLLNVRLDVCLASHNMITQNFEKEPLKWVTHFFESQNWNTPLHHSSQSIICRCWKRNLLKIRLRHLFRARRIYEELLMVTMHPDHILQTDTFSPEWFLKPKA